MSRPLLIRAQALRKVYPRVHRRRERLHSLGRILLGRAPTEVDVVLDGVNLEVRQGHSVGIIGENGAGKSTLLKLISGVLTPSSGLIERHGRIGALLELGAGFHPEQTGLENLRLAAALMGLKPAEIRAKTPEILDFADIGPYIERPVKHYSSGMVVRLGFAIIAAVRPELLITDEVLAVGDEGFQKKCIRWIESYLAAGGTLLLVSHSMYHVQKLCREALWLKDGRVERRGDVFEVSQAYLAWHERRNSNLHELDPSYAGSEYRVVGLTVNGSESSLPLDLPAQADLDVELLLHSPDDRPPAASVGLVRADGTPVYGLTSDMEQARPRRLGPGRYRFGIRFESPPLLPGAYRLRAHALDPEALRLYDTVERELIIAGQSREFGLVRLPHRWHD